VPRPTAAEGAAQAQGRSTARPRLGCPWRYRLRPAHRMPLAAAAEGARLRQRLDLLATAPRLAGGRRLGEAARAAAGLAGRRGGHRLEPRQRRQPERPGQKGARRPGRTRPTAASPAPSTTSSSTRGASPSPSASRRPTPTTRPSCSPWSTRSRRSSGRGDGRGGPGSARPSCTPTRRTMLRPCAVRCGLAASPRGSRGGGSTRASGWAGTAGWSSAPWLGCSVAAGSGCGTSGERTCSRACCTWRARWSASGSSARERVTGAAGRRPRPTG
jgi:hypothetical protein